MIFCPLLASQRQFENCCCEGIACLDSDCFQFELALLTRLVLDFLVVEGSEASAAPQNPITIPP
jgi:hypothetical protein